MTAAVLRRPAGWAGARGAWPRCAPVVALALALASAMSAAQARADDGRVHTFHCLDACPRGAPEDDDLIVREIYTLSADPLTKMAVWVAYRVTPDTIGPSGRRSWRADSWLAPDETLEPDDYDGAAAAIGADRGHQTPLAAFSATPYADETNLLSNITPQGSALNQGPWQRLEAKETMLARKENTAVYVLTGPLFERMMPSLPGADERHRVPSGYWKVIMTQDGRATGFIFDQAATRDLSPCSARASIEVIELRARLRLTPMRARAFEPLDAALGCEAPLPSTIEDTRRTGRPPTP